MTNRWVHIFLGCFELAPWRDPCQGPPGSARPHLPTVAEMLLP